MESVNVVVTNSMGDEALQRINNVSPRIRLTDVSDFARGEGKGDFSRKEQLDAVLAEAEVVYALKPPKNLVGRAPRLRWIQMYSTGVDGVLDDELRRSSVEVTNMSGCHETSMCEFVLMLMLMFVKQAPRSFCQKVNKEYQWFPVGVLRSKTVGLVGLGRVGREVARLAKVFGMRVIATRRSAKRVSRARCVDKVLPREQLEELLSDSDFVVLALPLTSETRGLIGEKELRAMKPTAYLINVARGGLVDEKALVRALDERWFAGAGLDVFGTEPLPGDSPLRGFPNVIFSPHVAGDIEDYNVRAAELFCENLRRYLDGRRLLNLVDKTKGY
ncbi:MAG: D-2-hydroxyacid dehydrogenase [Dehalococcoidia bacterium]|nr:D-2-hydroxyacid dehydrogenase [Dehalococcoidia bacterium]